MLVPFLRQSIKWNVLHISVIVMPVLDNSLWGKFGKMSIKRIYTSNSATDSSNNRALKKLEDFNDTPENDWLIWGPKMMSTLFLCSPCRQKSVEVGFLLLTFM